MNRKMIFLPILAIALVSLACSFNINLPGAQDKTGPTITEDIRVPFFPDAQTTADITLNFGAGNLTIKPGATDALISGIARYNVTDLKPRVNIESNNVNIEQGDLELGGLPYISRNIENDWELSLANRPITLVIAAGAYRGIYELGGLSIQSLEVRDGASDVDLSFAQPNQVDMTRFEYTTGASDVSLIGLGNANPAELTFQGGAGSYTLDFNGQLKRDMTVNIESGISSVTLVIPVGVSAQLTNESNLVSVEASSAWEQQGNSYLHPGSGPEITILVRMGAGTLRLETGR